MRKGVPLTNREQRGRNQYENAFLQKNEVGVDHLKLLFPLGRSSRDPTLFTPFEKMFEGEKAKFQKNKQIVIANLGPTGPRAAGQLKSPPISMYPDSQPNISDLRVNL